MEERRGRHSIRLKGWDYRAAGWYFITVGTHLQRRILAELHHDQLVMTPIGDLVATQWERISVRFPEARLDSLVIMPNHLHGLIEVVGVKALPTTSSRCSSVARPNGTVPGSIAAIIQGFKSGSARTISKRFPAVGRVWHRGYYERIVRDQRGIDAVRRYIAANPARWIAQGR